MNKRPERLVVSTFLFSIVNVSNQTCFRCSTKRKTVFTKSHTRTHTNAGTRTHATADRTCECCHHASTHGRVVWQEQSTTSTHIHAQTQYSAAECSSKLSPLLFFALSLHRSYCRSSNTLCRHELKSLQAMHWYWCHVACISLVFVNIKHSHSTTQTVCVLFVVYSLTHTCFCRLRVQHRAYEINQQRQISLWYMQDRETPARKKIHSNQSKSLSGDACTTIQKAEHIPHENAPLPHHTFGPFHRNCECEAHQPVENSPHEKDYM